MIAVSVTISASEITKISISQKYSAAVTKATAELVPQDTSSTGLEMSKAYCNIIRTGHNFINFQGYLEKI